MLDLIGKKIVAIKGIKQVRNQKEIEIRYILFDDGKTYLELNEQDYYTYHDCAGWARVIMKYVDKAMWERIMFEKDVPESSRGYFVDATRDDFF